MRWSVCVCILVYVCGVPNLKMAKPLVNEISNINFINPYLNQIQHTLYVYASVHVFIWSSSMWPMFVIIWKWHVFGMFWSVKTLQNPKIKCWIMNQNWCSSNEQTNTLTYKSNTHIAKFHLSKLFLVATFWRKLHWQCIAWVFDVWNWCQIQFNRYLFIGDKF